MLIHVTDKQEAQILAWLQSGTLKETFRPVLHGIYKYAQRGVYLATNGFSLFAVKQDQLPVLADLPDNSVHILNNNKAVRKTADQYLEAELETDAMPNVEPSFEAVIAEKETASLYVTQSIIQAMFNMPVESRGVILRMFVGTNHTGYVSVESSDGNFIAFCASCGWPDTVQDK